MKVFNILNQAGVDFGRRTISCQMNRVLVFIANYIYKLFSRFEVIDANNDILNLFINFEHSYMGDLITFVCPEWPKHTGPSQGGGGTYLGVPVDDNFCLMIQGIGWDYYWDPNATNGTWEDNAGGTLLSGAYESLQPFSNLNGCPFNGTWEIEVCDLWSIDNGFIFDWSISI